MKSISDRAHELAREWARTRTGVRDPDYEVDLAAIMYALDAWQLEIEERIVALEIVNSPDQFVDDKAFQDARDLIQEWLRREHRFKVDKKPEDT